MGTVKKWPRKGLSGRWWGEAGRERIMRRENRERGRGGETEKGREQTGGAEGKEGRK